MIALLEAVNEMLEAIGEPNVTTYTTGDGSDAAEAEYILLRETKRILERGWACNIDINTELPLPDRKFVYTGADPAGFVYGEVVTQAGSGATGYFECIDPTNNYLFLRWISGTFTNTGNLAGATGSQTPDTVETVTSGQLGASDDWLSFRSSDLESRVVVRRGSRIYNASDMTYELTEAVKIYRHINASIIDLPNRLARYCVTTGSLAFQKYKKRGQVDESMIAARLMMDRQEAVVEDEEARRIVVTATPEAYSLKGARRSGRLGGLGVDENYTYNG